MLTDNIHVYNFEILKIDICVICRNQSLEPWKTESLLREEWGPELLKLWGNFKHDWGTLGMYVSYSQGGQYSYS